MMGTEYRFLNATDFKGEFRVEKRDGKPSMIVGYPAKFNKLSQRMWGMREMIMPGAFKRTLAEGADVRGLLNHDPNLILGRTKAGTMRLKEDSTGLRMEIDAPDTQMARDLITSIDRGDIDQGSFRFRTITDNWRMQDGETIRELLDVDLMDASVVTFPAYEDTDIGVRSLAKEAGMELARFEEVMVRLEHNLPAKPEDRDFLGLVVHRIEKMREKLPVRTLRSVEAAKRRLRLTEL
jgi:HK97 family phage prohead protease